MSLLAADLDGRVVVLDPAQARVILLEARSERIWRACGGRTQEEIAAATGETSPDLTRALDDLAAAGLIAPAAGRWNRAPVTWI